MIRTTVSIIVTSYTTEQLKDIMELLESIKAQTYPDIEMIFVAERSRELYELVKAQEQNMPNMKVIFNDDEPGLSASRNLGIREAKGDIIAFVDDDALLYPQWAEETVKGYAKDDSIIGLTGPILPLWQDRSMAWFPREFYWIFSCTYYDWTEPREVRNGYGTNISFRREAFISWVFTDTFGRTLGFHKAGKRGPVGDETEFSINLRMKTGKVIIYNPNVKVWHRVYKYRATSIFIARRAYWEGYTKAMFKKLYGKEEKVLTVEYELLRRIFLKLFPDILRGFFTNPVTAWRRFSVTVVVLLAVASGYIFCLFKEPPNKRTLSGEHVKKQ